MKRTTPVVLSAIMAASLAVPASALPAADAAEPAASGDGVDYDPCTRAKQDFKRYVVARTPQGRDGRPSSDAAAGTREARTALRYTTAFYPRWFTYYQAGIAPCNSLIGPRGMNPLYQTVVAINDDTLYGSAVVDVRAEPVIVTVPATAAVYSILHLDGFGNVFDGIPGGQPGTYALTPPGWVGSTDGITQVPMPYGVTTLIFRADRYAADGQSTEQAAAQFRTDLRLAPWSQYQQNPGAGATKIVPVAAFGTPFKLLADKLATQRPLAFLRSLQRALANPATQPLSAREQKLADRIDTMMKNPRQRQRLQAGVVAAHEGIVSNYLTNTLRESPWITFRNMGEWRNNFAGYRDRSSIAEYILYGNNRKAARYFHAFTDSSGDQLAGRNGAYRIRFAARQLPEVKRFWSVTAYTPKAIELVPNAARKYLVGSYTPGLVTGRDGSVTITMSVRRPRGVPKANWLPVPRGSFNVMLRAYGPEGRLKAGGYVPPPVRLAAGD